MHTRNLCVLLRTPCLTRICLCKWTKSQSQGKRAGGHEGKYARYVDVVFGDLGLARAFGEPGRRRSRLESQDVSCSLRMTVIRVEQSLEARVRQLLTPHKQWMKHLTMQRSIE